MASICFLLKRQLLAPASAYIGLLIISLADCLPINSTMLIGWLCMTLVVTAVTAMHPAAIRQQTNGLGYITVGGFAGMSVGLLGYSIASDITMLYGLMMLACIAGIFFGYFFFTTTPKGKAVGLKTGNFFTYLLAKGFPVAITLIQIGIAIVLFLAINQQHSQL